MDIEATCRLRDALCRAGLDRALAPAVTVEGYSFHGGHPHLFSVRCRDGRGASRQIHRIEDREEFSHFLAHRPLLERLASAIRWVVKQGSAA